MADLSDKESKEVSLQTHGYDEFLAIGVECFCALNMSAFLISICRLIMLIDVALVDWLTVVIVLTIGGYIASLVYRHRRIGWVYAFLCGLGCAIALRHL